MPMARGTSALPREELPSSPLLKGAGAVLPHTAVEKCTTQAAGITAPRVHSQCGPPQWWGLRAPDYTTLTGPPSLGLMLLWQALLEGSRLLHLSHTSSLCLLPSWLHCPLLHFPSRAPRAIFLKATTQLRYLLQSSLVLSRYTQESHPGKAGLQTLPLSGGLN